ncbi:hypothetical protein [Bdellovibrio sp. BCCA]|uniref:hypothetical protein n=1 Tax=unclassified Bdellovibrio TaxID=2633795 RepID=UPI0025EA3BC7|nr:hypothetical protein [uncultured Bdellovibrio sp.]
MINPLRNRKGQFVIEGVLLLVVTVSAFLWATNYARDNKFLAKLIAGPWTKISGMIEAGVWEAPDKARKQHPNQIDRSNTVKPEGQ